MQKWVILGMRHHRNRATTKEAGHAKVYHVVENFDTVRSGGERVERITEQIRQLAYAGGGLSGRAFAVPERIAHENLSMPMSPRITNEQTDDVEQKIPSASRKKQKQA